MNDKRALRYIGGFALLAVLAAVFFFLGLVSGSSDISAAQTAEVLSGRDTASPAARIILNIRLPRVLAALILGGALSVAGYMLQSFFSNPIAGPFVLGISSGAKLTAAIVMIFSLKSGHILGSAELTGAAFAGSMTVTAIILAVSGRVKNMAQLIITGVMIGYICNAVTELAVTFADDSNIVNLHNWSMGSFSGTDMADVGFMAIVVMISLAAAFLLSKPMEAYRLGESYAENMGVRLRPFKLCMIFLSGVLSACVTAFAGPVSFVGVAVPHLMKSLFGTAKPIIIIPAAFLGGGVFCMICDLLARMLFAPSELSVSTVTAVFGAPVVIAAMLGKKRGGG